MRRLRLASAVGGTRIGRASSVAAEDSASNVAPSSLVGMMEAEGNPAMQALLDRYRRSHGHQPSSQPRPQPAFRAPFPPPPVNSSPTLPTVTQVPLPAFSPPLQVTPSVLSSVLRQQNIATESSTSWHAQAPPHYATPQFAYAPFDPFRAASPQQFRAPFPPQSTPL